MKFLTKRFLLSVAGMIAFTWLANEDKLTAEWYTLGILGCIAGNHAQDLIAAWRGNAVSRVP